MTYLSYGPSRVLFTVSLFGTVIGVCVKDPFIDGKTFFSLVMLNCDRKKPKIKEVGTCLTHAR